MRYIFCQKALGIHPHREINDQNVQDLHHLSSTLFPLMLVRIAVELCCCFPYQC
jgi:hypothetical protein